MNKQNLNNFGTTFKLSLVLISIVILPFVNILHFVFPVDNLLGKSAWLVFPVVVLVVIYSQEAFFKNNVMFNVHNLLLIFISFIGGIILYTRYILYEEVQDILNFRYLATSLIYLMLASQLVKEWSKLRILSVTIVLLGMAISFAQVVNFHLYPSVILQADSLGLNSIVFDGIKPRSKLFGASISGNQILCSMFVLVAVMKSGIVNINYWLFWAGMVFMAYAISLGASRYPMFIATTLFLFSIYYLNNSNKRKLILLVAVFSSITIIYIFAPSDITIFTRISEDSGGRVEKTQLAIQMLSERMTNFIIGPSGYQTDNSRLNGYAFSDNSYFYVGLTFGVPFAVVYFLIFFNHMRSCVDEKLALFFVCYLVIGFSLTNCILWESWLCMAMFSVVVLIKNRNDQNLAI